MSYTRDQLIQMVTDAARKYGIRPDIALAQIYQESGFNPNAVSSAGAKGLAQFIPATAARFGLSNPFDPAASLEAWGKYMSSLLRQFNGRYDIALAGYNSGEARAEYRAAAAQGRAINWASLPAGVQSQTRNYVNVITSGAQGWAGTVGAAASNIVSAVATPIQSAYDYLASDPPAMFSSLDTTEIVVGGALFLGILILWARR